MPIRPAHESKIRHAADLAKSLNDAGNSYGAIEILEKALKRDRRDADALNTLGIAYATIGRYELAISQFKNTLDASPRFLGAHQNLAIAQTTCGRFDDAMRTLDRALSQYSGDPCLLSTKAEVLAMTGDLEQAAKLLDPLLMVEQPDPFVVNTFAGFCDRIGRSTEGIELLKTRLQDSTASPDQERTRSFFKLADLQLSKGSVDEAWQNYLSANQSMPQTFDSESHSIAIDRVISGWSDFSSVPVASKRTEQPVFIVGMPRSGTSLVEQILDMHPDFVGGGEISSLRRAIASIGGLNSGHSYFDETASITQRGLDIGSWETTNIFSAFAKKAIRASDKTPYNFVNLGLIQVMLPGARVIHCVRDPMDTCVSCFTQHFANHNEMSRDLSALGSYFSDYSRLMQHWNRVLDLQILEVRYEALVDDINGESRRMIDFLNLPWNESCLDFHKSSRVTLTASNAQVHRPIFSSSVGRWRKFETHLGLLMSSLDQNTRKKKPLRQTERP